MNKLLIFLLLVLLAALAGGLQIEGLIHLESFFPPKNNVLSTYTPVTSPKESLTLILSSPDDNLLTFQENLLIQGKTTPGSLLILSTENSDEAKTVGSSGDFSFTITLTKGLNQIQIASFAQNGNQQTEIRNVYYSKEQI